MYSEYNRAPFGFYYVEKKTSKDFVERANTNISIFSSSGYPALIVMCMLCWLNDPPRKF